MMKALFPLQSILLLALPFALGVSAMAGEVNKAANTDALNLPSSWTGGAVPGTGDIAHWVNNQTVALGGNLSVAGIRATSAGGGTITATPGATLTVGASGFDLDASQNFTIEAAVHLSADQSWNVVRSNRSLRINGALTGAGDLNLTGDGTVSFNGGVNNTFTGNIAISAGTLSVTTQNGLNTRDISITTGTLDLRGANQTIGKLTGSATAVVHRGVVGGSTRLHVNSTEDSTFSGTIDNLSLTKKGTGALTLAGDSSLLGATNVEAGKLLVNGNLSSGTVDVQTGATLGGYGGVITSDVTLANGAKLEINLNAPETTGLAVLGNLNLGSDIALNLNLERAVSSTDVFTLLSATGNLTPVSFASVNGHALEDGNIFSLVYNSVSYDFVLNYGDHAITAQMVPEPASAFLVLFGAGSYALLRRRSHADR